MDTRHSLLSAVVYLWLAAEKQRLKTHLTRALLWLRHRKSHSLKRTLALGVLQQYVSGDCFPINCGTGYTPIFIDEFGTHCAVGYLIAHTVSFEVAQKLDTTHHFDYVLGELRTNSTVNSWAEEYDFTLSELAFVQPGYWGLDHFVCNFVVMGLVSLALCVFVLVTFDRGDALGAWMWYGAVTVAATQVAQFVAIFIYAKKSNAPLIASTAVNCAVMVYFIIVLALVTAPSAWVYAVCWVMVGVFAFGVTCCLFPCTLFFHGRRDINSPMNRKMKRSSPQTELQQ